MTLIERGSRAAEIASAVVALIESVDIGNKRRSGCFVKAVEQIESFHDQINPHPFAEIECAGQTQIKRRIRMRDAAIAPERSFGKFTAGDQRRNTTLSARNTQRSVGIETRTVGLT